MIANGELSILKLVSEKNLIKKSEILKLVEQEKGSVERSLEILKDKGFVDIVAPLGETSFVVTQKGARFISESGS